jgi:hypothetical protein
MVFSAALEALSFPAMARRTRSRKAAIAVHAMPLSGRRSSERRASDSNQEHCESQSSIHGF